MSNQTKAQLAEALKESQYQADYLQDKMDFMEENKFDSFKEELGMPYNTDDEWIDYIKRLQEINADRLKDLQDTINLLQMFKTSVASQINNSVR